MDMNGKYIVSWWRGKRYVEFEESNYNKAKEIADNYGGTVYVSESGRIAYEG